MKIWKWVDVLLLFHDEKTLYWYIYKVTILLKLQFFSFR